MFGIPTVRPIKSKPLPAQRVGRAALALARETRALLIQSTMMHRDLSPSMPRDVAEGEPVVVVLHGLFATAGALRPLRRRIELATGCRTGSFSYEPGCDLTTLVERLRGLLGTLPATSPIDLVGHSMGGVVSRYYVQVGDGDPRVRQTISLASPFRGSNIAKFVPDFFCHDLGPDSAVLHRLLRHHDRAAHIPHTSIASTHDQLVWPWHSAIYPHGRRVIISACGHNTLLFDPTVAEHVTRALLHSSANPKSVSADHKMAREPSARGSLPLAS